MTRMTQIWRDQKHSYTPNKCTYFRILSFKNLAPQVLLGIGLRRTSALSAEMIGRAFSQWKLIKWLTLLNILSFVRTWTKFLCWNTKKNKQTQRNLQFLQGQLTASAFWCRLASLRGRTALQSLEIPAQESRHPYEAVFPLPHGWFVRETKFHSAALQDDDLPFEAL